MRASQMSYVKWLVVVLLVLAVLARNPHAVLGQPSTEATVDFGSDPKWDAFRNRLLPKDLPVVRQDFGYR